MKVNKTMAPSESVKTNLHSRALIFPCGLFLSVKTSERSDVFTDSNRFISEQLPIQGETRCGQQTTFLI